jgi:hypothetical protein
MALETATYINSLVTTWPLGSDQRSTSDDHHRLVKGALSRTFPNLAGEVSISHGEANFLRSASWNIQAQLNAMKGIFDSASVSGTVHYAMSAGNARMLNSLSADQFMRSRYGLNLGTLSGTLNLEPASYAYFSVVLAGNVTSVSLGQATSHGEVFSIRFQQDGAGGANVAGWPAAVVWADGSVFSASSTASAIDFVTMVWDSPLGVWLAAPRKYG